MSLYPTIDSDAITNEKEKEIYRLMTEDMEYITKRMPILKEKLIGSLLALTKMLMRDNLEFLKGSQQKRWNSDECLCKSTKCCGVKEHEKEDDQVQLLTYFFQD